MTKLITPIAKLTFFHPVIAPFTANRPPDAIKIAIAQYFDVSVDFLLGLTEVPTPLEKQSQVLRLPVNFPKRMLPELMNYVEYLVYKEKKRG